MLSLSHLYARPKALAGYFFLRRIYSHKQHFLNKHLLFLIQAPDCLLDLLQPSTPDDVLIAWLMFLSDVLTTSKTLCLTFSSLPVSRSRVESPLTLYTALYGWSNTSQLKTKAFVLSRHGNELIARLASSVYICLMS